MTDELEDAEASGHSTQALERSLELQKAVNRLLRLSSEDTPLEEVVEKALDAIISIPGLSLQPKGGIWLTESPSCVLTLKAHRGFGIRQIRACSEVPFGYCVCGLAALKKSAIFESTLGESHKIRYEGIAPHGHYCVPLISKGETIGVLTFYVREGTEKDESEAEFLTSVASVLSGVIEGKRIEGLITRKFIIEKALAEVSRLFISREENYVNEALRILGEAADVNRAHIFQITEGGDKMSNTFEWCSSDTAPQIENLQNIPTSTFGWSMKKLLTDENIIINDVEGLPPEALVEKKELKRQEIKSLLFIPIWAKDRRLFGFAGFDDTEKKRVWTDDHVLLFRVAADIISRDFERKLADEAIRKIGYYDSLTGLPNRRLLSDHIAQALSRSRWRKRDVAVTFLNIDGFKEINDTYGHEAGDRLLQTIAGRLKSCLRDGDIIARHGADEFMMLLEDMRSSEDVYIVISKLLSSFRQPVYLGGNEVYVTASVGVSLFPYDGSEPETLLRKADTAMHQAKRQGRNEFRLYSPAMDEKIAEKFEKQRRLHLAVERDEFVLHYQPQADLKTGDIVGFEALVRWQDPVMGIIPPSEFIPLAEETGVISELGRRVLKWGCAQNRVFNAGARNNLVVSVNVSAKQFMRKDFIETVGRILLETGLDSRLLELELTEGVIMENTDETLGAMKELKALGVRFAIDDFGMGYSSLRYLKYMPVDLIKIDRSFVQNVPANPDDASIVTAIIRLAQSLKIEVVAEGVETTGQLKFLSEMRCNRIQGYVFSKPLTAEGALRLLNEDIRLDLNIN